ncbi:MAG: tetratricopeptide repeat protein [Bacteroidota bacterium]
MRNLLGFSFLSLLLWCCSSDYGRKNPESEKVVLDSLMLDAKSQLGRMEFEEAVIALDNILGLSERIDDPEYKIRAHNISGSIYSTYNLHDEALENYFQSLEISEREKIDKYLNSIYNNIGISYAINASMEQAADYFGRALEISRVRNDSVRTALNLTNLSNCLNELGLRDSSLICLKESLKLYGKLGKSIGYLATLNNIGNVFDQIGVRDSALFYYHESYKGAGDKEDPKSISVASLNLAQMYSQSGDFEQAQSYIDKSIDGFNMLKDGDNLVSSYKAASEIALGKGENQASVNFLNEALNLQDSLAEVRSSQWVSKHQLNYEFGKKEKELEIVEAAAERRQRYWLIGILAAGLLSILAFLLMRSRIIRLKQRNLLLKKEKEFTDLALEKNLLIQKREKEERETQIKISEIEREKLRQELDFKNRELVSNVINIANQNEKMNTILSLLEKAEGESSANEYIKESKSLIYSQKALESEWDTFKIHFEEVHPNFFARLSAQYPSLSTNDLRMCAFIVLNLTPKEISLILNIAPSSIRKRKQRLKEKLDIPKEEEIKDWMNRNVLTESDVTAFR